MLTDEQYGDRLAARLRQETADVRAAPDLPRILRRRHARRVWTIRAAIATPVAALAAAAIVVTTAGTQVPDGRQEPRAGGGVPSADSRPVRLETVAHVQAQTIKALTRASDYVIYSKTIHKGDPYGVYEEQWLDKATQRSRVDYYEGGPRMRINGKPGGKVWFTIEPDPAPGRVQLGLSQSFSGPLGNQIMVQVNYFDRMWHQERYTNDAPPPAPDITDANSVRKAIADGTLELLGEEKVDGIDALHLRLYGPEKSQLFDMWVDAESYLPVKEISDKSPAAPDSVTLTTTYRWLPRTEENLARLVLTPPPGFKRS